jgi:hypothetical protein
MSIQPKPYPETPSTPFNLEPLSPEAIEQLAKILDEWMEDDSGYDEETWPELKVALNLEREHINARRLFVDRNQWDTSLALLGRL